MLGLLFSRRWRIRACVAGGLRLGGGVKRRSFSLMLARRYLNPRRSMLSSFSLISLVGVMLGVLVLVVVMAVYAGMERDVKGRLLGFTPHILLRQEIGGQPLATMTDWQEAAAMAAKLPGVEAATPFVADHVVIDGGNFRRPVQFRGVDTSDPVQVKGVEAMLAKDTYPDSTADLGLDDRVVVSSLVAENYGLSVGDRLRLISSGNIEAVVRAYKSVEKPALREAYAEVWNKATAALAAAWKPEGDGFMVAVKTLQDEVYTPLSGLLEEPIREPELDLLGGLLVALEDNTKDEAAGVYRFAAPQRQAVEEKIASLRATDVATMDAEILKGLNHIVLPREVTVVGVYQASMMVLTPDLFVPLQLAQDLAGTEGAVQGVALRLKDAYQAEKIAAEGRARFGAGWSWLTWAQQFEGFFSVINQQRVMLYFALSFIVLVSAFSMMAVMFTVTIQKRREIGVMKALGAAPGQIVRVFLYQGMLLGVLGAVLGVALGRVVIHFRGELQAVMRSVGFDPFSMVTGSQLLPAHNDPGEQAVIALMGFLLCSLAAFVPAFFAARSDAAKSLRNL